MGFPQNPAGGGGGKQLWDYTLNANNFFSATVGVNAGLTVTIFTLNGKGIIASLHATVDSPSLSPIISVDGVDYELAVQSSTLAQLTTVSGSVNFSSSTTTASPRVLILDFPIKFKTSFAFKLKNYSGSAVTNTTVTTNTIYYT